jgi:hypothetical protein
MPVTSNNHRDLISEVGLRSGDCILSLSLRLFGIVSYLILAAYDPLVVKSLAYVTDTKQSREGDTCADRRNRLWWLTFCNRLRFSPYISRGGRPCEEETDMLDFSL